MIRPSVVWLATLMASPSLYRAYTGELSVQDALGRFLLAVVVAAVMVGMLRFVTANYGERGRRQFPLRRRSDPPAGSGAAGR
jgi:hypothetical protein